MRKGALGSCWRRIQLEREVACAHPGLRSGQGRTLHNFREETMKGTRYGIIVAAALIVSTGAIAQTPSWAPPPENQRCPSKGGAGHERASGNNTKTPTGLKPAPRIQNGPGSARGD